MVPPHLPKHELLGLQPWSTAEVEAAYHEVRSRMTIFLAELCVLFLRKTMGEAIAVRNSRSRIPLAAYAVALGFRSLLLVLTVGLPCRLWSGEISPLHSRDWYYRILIAYFVQE